MGKSAKNWFGHKFWLEGPIDKILISPTRLNYILQDLFRDTPIDHIWRAQICQILLMRVLKLKMNILKVTLRWSSQKLHYPGQAGAPVEIILHSGELPCHQIWNAITAASLSSPPSFLISWRFNTRGRWPASQQKQVCLEQITPRVEEYWSMGPGANPTIIHDKLGEGVRSDANIFRREAALPRRADH